MLKWNGGGFDRPQTTKGEKMPYLVLKSCVHSGGVLHAGDIVEIDIAEASALCAMNRIQEHDAAVEVPVMVDRKAVVKNKRAKA